MKNWAVPHQKKNYSFPHSKPGRPFFNRELFIDLGCCVFGLAMILFSMWLVGNTILEHYAPEIPAADYKTTPMVSE